MSPAYLRERGLPGTGLAGAWRVFPVPPSGELWLEQNDPAQIEAIRESAALQAAELTCCRCEAPIGFRWFRYASGSASHADCYRGLERRDN